MTDKIKLLNVGYPKVGNTWIGRTLSYALNAQFREYDNEGNIIPDTLNKDTLKKIGGDISGREKTKIKIVEKTHYLPNVWKNWDKDYILKIIYIVRDPRDIAISLFFYKYHHRPYKEYGQIKKYSKLEKRKFIFKTICSYYIHQALWEPYITYKISYEDQWLNTHKALASLLERLEISYGDDYLNEAIRNFSWENVSKGRKPGETENKEFLRSGISGSYRREYDFIDHIIYFIAFIISRIIIFKKQRFPNKSLFLVDASLRQILKHDLL